MIFLSAIGSLGFAYATMVLYSTGGSAPPTTGADFFNNGIEFINQGGTPGNYTVTLNTQGAGPAAQVFYLSWTVMG
jgi:hypothetical protein